MRRKRSKGRADNERGRRWKRHFRAAWVPIIPFGRRGVYMYVDGGEDASISDRGRRKLWVFAAVLAVLVAALWTYVLTR